MVGDWIFSLFLILIFVIEIIIGGVISNSSSGITPILRKSDTNLDQAYIQFNIAGQLSLYNGIIGIVIIMSALLVLLIPPALSKFEQIPLYGKIIGKSFYGIIAIIMTILVSFYLYQAADSMKTSHTYKLSRFQVRKDFDDAISYTNLTANLYIGLATILTLLFIGLGIYDACTKNKASRKTIIVNI